MFIEKPKDLIISDDIEVKKDFIHYFCKSAEQLEENLYKLKDEISENRMIWVSWPKKASKVVSDVSEDIVRDIAISCGLVDVKVCSIDTIWSGLKLVKRLKDRKI